MKFLVYGAGVLGSLYAAKLQESGQDVTVLARGRRLEQIREHGIVLVEEGTGVFTTTRVRTIERLEPDDAYDFVLVVMRKNQVGAVLPALAASRATPNVVFMVNSATGGDEMISLLGKERVILGFPGAGGAREGHVVHYRLATAVQPNTFGEPDGRVTERLRQLGQAFTAAGLPVVFSAHMDAWLKTHVALVSPIANALYLAGGDNYRLARTPDGLVLMVRAIKEGLRVLKALNIPIEPAHYRALLWIPEPVLVGMLRRSMHTEQAELVMARHANAARDEMEQLADEFQMLARKSGLETPAIDALYPYIDPTVPVVAAGTKHLAMDWRGVWLAAGVVSSVLLGVYYWRRRS
jgi:2-dehydropantoate 2-reductase